jgi:hypothetical protein
MKYSQQQVRAYHEAAHAVVAICFKEKFRYIELREELMRLPDGSQGTRSGKTVFPRRLYHKNEMKDAVISLAAIVAEKIMHPHNSYFKICSGPGYTDRLRVNKALSYGQDFRSLKEDQQMLVQSFIGSVALPVARKTVKSNWGLIVAVGDRLIKKGKLTYKEVSEICQSVQKRKEKT